MIDLITMSRTMKIYYHHLHNVVSGESFSSDHELLSNFYTQLDSSYDMLIERYIGLGNECGKDCLLSIMDESIKALKEMPNVEDMNTLLQYALNLELIFQKDLEEADRSATYGTKNLLQQLACESEVRVYKLNQRVK